MEEPLGHIAFQDRQRIARHITDKSQPWTLVCITTDSMLASMCDRIVVLKSGKIVAIGNYDEIRATEHFDKIFK